MVACGTTPRMAKSKATRKSKTDPPRTPRVALSPSPEQHEKWKRAAEKARLKLATWAFTVVDAEADRVLAQRD
jgi:hypothetical protein